jgi:hypothetical protein
MDVLRDLEHHLGRAQLALNELIAQHVESLDAGAISPGFRDTMYTFPGRLASCLDYMATAILNLQGKPANRTPYFLAPKEFTTEQEVRAWASRRYPGLASNAPQFFDFLVSSQPALSQDHEALEPLEDLRQLNNHSKHRSLVPEITCDRCRGVMIWNRTAYPHLKPLLAFAGRLEFCDGYTVEAGPGSLICANTASIGESALLFGSRWSDIVSGRSRPHVEHRPYLPVVFVPGVRMPCIRFAAMAFNAVRDRVDRFCALYKEQGSGPR